MPQIFDVIANENARYKPNELELNIGSVLVDFLRPKFRVAHTKHDVISIYNE